MQVEHYAIPRRAKRRRAAAQRRRVVRQRRAQPSYGRRATSRELKFFDTDVDDAAIAGLMTINNLTIIPQGTTESTRIGRKLRVRRISWKYQITIAAKTDASLTADIVKCMLVWDKQTNKAEYTALDMIETDVWDAFRNLANSKRFVVLHTEDIELGVTGAAASGAAFVFGGVKKYVIGNKNCDIPIEYNNSSTDGAITSVTQNNLYWVTQSTAGVSAGIGTVRLRFSDD